MSREAVDINSEKYKDDPDINSCTILINEIGFGVWQYTCWSKRCNVPIAIAFVDVTSGKLCIAILCHIYVRPEWRRHGVASALIDSIFGIADRIETGIGSTDGGMALLRSQGWEYDESRCSWFLLKTQYKKKWHYSI